MIVPMKKLTLLCVEHAREEALTALRELGVVHLKPVVMPAGTDVETARSKVSHLQRLLAILPKVKTGEMVPSNLPPEKIVDELSRLAAAKKELEARQETLATEIARVAPFGNFNPSDIHDLASRRIVLKLYKALAKKTPPLPENVQGQHLSQVKGDSYWVLYARDDFDWPGAEQQRLPEVSLADMQKQMQDLQAQRTQNTEAIRRFAEDRPALKTLLTTEETELRFQEARAGMGSAEKVAFLQGFIAESDTPKVEETAAQEGWGFVLEDPGPQDDVPVKLKPPRWASPITAVFEGIDILPAYNEADISVVFMLFFSLFFAMIVGDAGYGLIFLVMTLAFRKKLPKNAVHLLVVTSLCTVAWGLASGSIFGISHDVLARAGLGRLQVSFIQDAKNLMGLCFLIGAIQITIGHVWNVVDLIQARSLKAFEQFGWILTTWFMFFVADNMVLHSTMLGYLHMSDAHLAIFWKTCIISAIAGVVLIILFMMKPSEFKEGWFNLALLPLNIINNFTDVVSYVRLYAVGSAGFAVANAFNNMLFGGEVTWWSGILGAVLLFVAHTLNILLCLMGVLVHGIRLNTLEFSNHKGISWSGTPFRPFARPDVAT